MVPGVEILPAQLSANLESSFGSRTSAVSAFAKVQDRNLDTEIRERTMTGNLEAGSQQAPVEMGMQFTGREKGKDAPAEAKVNPWYHPFDWWDFVLLFVPIAIIVFSMWWDAKTSPE